MNRMQAKPFFLFLMILFIVLVPILSYAQQDFSRQEIPGVLVIEFVQEPSFTVMENHSGALLCSDTELNDLLRETSARSFQAEFGHLMPQYYVLRFSPEMTSTYVVEALSQRSDVVNVYHDYRVPTSLFTVEPDDNLFSSQWHHPAINSTRSWAISQGSEDVIIGILDTGVNYEHEDLAEVIWVNEAEDLNGNGILDEEDINNFDDDGNGYDDDVIGWDWVNIAEGEYYPGEDGTDPDNDPVDFDGHGTHCSGDAAAVTNNHVGVAGTGWGCRVGCLRAGYTGDDGRGYVDLTGATSAITYATTMDFDVISMSFGGEGGDPPYFSMAIGLAADAGIVLVAAAGNSGSTIPHYPAANPNVIAVAASSTSGHLANWSNRGDWVSITAPGSSILSTTQDGNYGNASGTSMSTPVLAGVVGQLKALRPEWGRVRIEERIQNTAQPMEEAGVGAGLVDAGAAVDMFVSVDSVWTVADNGFERLLYDEEGTLGLHWWMLFGNGLNFDVAMTLSSENERVSFGEDSLYIGMVLETNSGTWEIPVTVERGSATYETVIIDVEISGLDNFNDPYSYTQHIPVRVGQAQVLVLDYDNVTGERIDYWYTTSLTNLGYSCESLQRWTVTGLEGLLNSYPVVITATGQANETIFGPGEMQVYADYVNNGGKWLVTGQNIANYMLYADPSALDTLLGVGFNSANANQGVIRGIADNSISDGMMFILAGEGGADNSHDPDVITAGETAEPLFVWNTSNMDLLGGVRNYVGDNDLVFLSFSLESVNDSLEDVTGRQEFLDVLFTEWQITGVEEEHPETAVPLQFALGTPWPNPTNGSFIVPVQVGSTGNVRMALYNILGQRVWQSERMIQASQRVVVAMPSNLSSGTYLLNAMLDGQSITRRIVLLK